MKNITTKTSLVLPLFCVALGFVVSTAQAAVIWNVDTSKTDTVWANVAVNPETFAVYNDAIDIGYNGLGYVPVPYFSTLMSGYSSGAEITSVDSFSLNLTISLPIGAPVGPFDVNLYVYTGAVGNPDLATTGDVTTADWNFPEFTTNTVLLQSNFLTPSSTSGTYSLGATGRANLLSYMQSNYVTNNYLTFTFRMATNSVQNQAYLYRFGSNADLTGALTTVPEPTTVALLLLGGAAVLIQRRRHKRTSTI